MYEEPVKTQEELIKWLDEHIEYFTNYERIFESQGEYYLGKCRGLIEGYTKVLLILKEMRGDNNG